MNFDAVKDLRVLMVGDAILDKYVFVRPLGKSTKESMLSVGYDRHEVYQGGVWAAAEHVRGLCAHVDVMHGARILTNTRYVEGANNRKLFALHKASEQKAAGGFDFEAYDLVIVADFGHGTMTPAWIDQACRKARFLAVNTQTNSSNFGFNLITKYPRADYVVIDELEARLAVHDQDAPIKDVALKLHDLGYRKLVVTLGSKGAIGFDGEFYQEPARGDQVVDTMGAGDAFLAVSAPFAAARCSIRELVQIGNRAGAAKVGVLGHTRAVTREDLR